ncbi:hypothetical protein [Streptomyces lunaelactis]|uniref:hypothetical protein n=1 Tax=Streptomyces lunaelactis TaxID=1535768 RepID=UPI001584F50C|nr:hypothetical protein [Streptomyces lunaelactis]NUK28301.1 hypothetical protein [Streptomyces lunaelactis]
MEIVITEGKVRSETTGPDPPSAKRARTVANFLPRPELLTGATIVHNLDENYTGIRFETNAGPVVVMMPVAAGFEFTVVHESETGSRILGSIKGQTLAARAIAYRISEFLRLKSLK